MSDRIDQIADAVLAVPGVLGLAADPDAADSAANGVIEGASGATAIHVLVDVDASIPETADEVRRVAHDVSGGRVDVTVEEVR